MKVIIHEVFADADDAANTLEHIAEMIRDGYVAGFSPGWDLVK